MSSETSGVNTMKRICSAIFLLIVSGVLLAVAGCSGESQQTDTTAVEETGLAAKAEPVTVRDTIEVALNEVIDRVRYGDKSGMYYNEFEYLRENMGFDEYLKQRAVHYAKTDTLKFLEVLDLKMYGHDSADVVLNVHSEGPSGIPSKVQDTLIVFYHNDRWIKPTVSTMKKQLEWEAETGRSSGKK